MALANDIASNPPICVRSIKQLLNGHDEDLVDIIPKKCAANATSAWSEDRLEAVHSFLEKRQPVFKGR